MGVTEIRASLGGQYGADVNFPVTVDEQNNPAFTGCIDRNP